MDRQKRVLGLVPARAGSRALAHKNLRHFEGTPLVVRAALTAKAADLVDEVVVSTDSPKILELCGEAGIECPFLRPSSLASDFAPSSEVAIHALDVLADAGRTFDALVLVEPTSPLRIPLDIDDTIQILIEYWDEFDAAITLGPVHTHPHAMFTLDGRRALRYELHQSMPGRRQDEEEIYYPYGNAYAIKVEKLRSERTFYPSRVIGKLIPRERCLEIDDIFDFVQAEALSTFTRTMEQS